MNLRSYSTRHIDVIIHDTTDEKDIYFTRIYGNPVADQRHLSWALLNRIGANRNGPWIVARDFNEVICQNEVKRQNMNCDSQMVGLRDALTKNNLTSLGSLARFVHGTIK